jgi:hypothetical protein
MNTKWQLASAVVILTLAGCGASQTTVGAPGAVTQNAALAQSAPTIVGQAQPGRSWMLPEAKTEDLLYVADSFCCIRVFSYPQGKPVGVLGSQPQLQGECSDKAGNVWVTSFRTASIVEYAHGSTGPTTTLSEYPYHPNGCSVDPVTGNLAVANTEGNVAIFRHARGSPKAYQDPNISSFFYCTYDNRGNLFADGQSFRGPSILAEFALGAFAFTDITIRSGIRPMYLQWDGANLAMNAWRDGSSKGPEKIVRVHVSGAEGTVVGETVLQEYRDKRPWQPYPQYWVQGDAIVGAGPILKNLDAALEFWRYPAGGKATRVLRVGPTQGFGQADLYGVTVSVAPK